MNAENMRKISNEVKQNYGLVFWNEVSPTFFEYMKAIAKQGENTCKISTETAVLDPHRWLFTPHLRNTIISELEKLGYTASYIDTPNSTYLQVNW